MRLKFHLRAAFVCTCIFYTSLTSCFLFEEKDADFDRDTYELIVSRGFRPQVHQVFTKDGYILTLYRIVNPFCQLLRDKPILLMHGLGGSSVDFILNSVGGNAVPPRDPVVYRKTMGNNLGFELSNFGYDVFLGNFRGNWYSSNHTHFDPKFDPRFWEFKLDDMIAYDLPAVIKYILRITRKPSLAYIAHSVGTTAMFGLLAARPNFARFVKPFVALSPAARISNAQGAIFPILGNIPYSEKALSAFYGPFPPGSRVQAKVTNMICANPLVEFFCKQTTYRSSSFMDVNMNLSRYSVFTNHYPQSSSSRTYAQMIQNFKSGRLSLFNYGPDYPLERIKSKHIALFYSRGDLISTYEDVQWLKNKLRVPLFVDKYMPDRSWSHFDFLWSSSAGRLVYADVVEVILKVEGEEFRPHYKAIKYNININEIN